MKMLRRMKILSIVVFLLSYASIGDAASVKLPGVFYRYIDYLHSYSATEENLIYYLNEILLLEQIPTIKEISEKIFPNIKDFIRIRAKTNLYRKLRQAHQDALKLTLTSRVSRIISRHREIKEYLANIARNPAGAANTISLDLKLPQENEQARALLLLMGLALHETPDNRFQLVEDYSPPNNEMNHYYLLSNLTTWGLEKQLTESRRFDFTLREFNTSLPWEPDFLQKITGLAITPDSFAEILTQDKRLQLFLGLLYRLSDREFRFLNNLAPDLAAWKKIYGDDKFLVGMFLLSHALRVKEGQIWLPGDPDPNAAAFWQKAAGIDPRQHPLEFLEQVAAKDNGKLNYFYIFTFFLPEESRKTLLFQFDLQKFREIYERVYLDKTEQITQLEIPGLKDLGFFTLLYALHIKDSEIEFPGGSDIWAAALGLKPNKNKGENSFAIIKYLLETDKKKNSLARFIPVYTKFFHRPEILNEEVIRTLYENYADYNVLADFIEKIPIKKPGTVLRLFSRAGSFMRPDLSNREKETAVAIFQSLLEVLALKARAMPAAYPFDALVDQLVQLPLQGGDLYDEVFRFLALQLKIDLTTANPDQAFWESFLPPKPDVIVLNQTYRLNTSPLIAAEIENVLEKQACTKLSLLVKINRLLERFPQLSGVEDEADIALINQLYEAFQQLPLPDELDWDAPKQLRYLLEPYTAFELFKTLNHLITKKGKQAPQPEIDLVIRKIKGECLLVELKNYLLACLYAVTVKNSYLQAFLNPNLIRYHDFSWGLDKNPWNYSGISQIIGSDIAYHLEGGLSRLNITLAYPLSDYLFGLIKGNEPILAIPVIYNNMDLSPSELGPHAYEYTGILTKFAEEMLEKARENPALRAALQEEAMTLTAGYHYRTLMSHLEQQAPQTQEKAESLLYFSEYLRLGQRLFHQGQFLTEFSQPERWRDLQDPSFSQAVPREIDALGPVFYHTFGSLKPYRYDLFPQPLSLLFASRWTCAEMIDELKIKAAYISYLQQMPSQILGPVIIRFLYQAASKYYQGSKIDYQRTYFLSSLFNYLYLDQIYNDFRKQGILEIK